MRKLKSLTEFLNENQELGKIESSKIVGGINMDSVKFYSSNTMTDQNCGDTRTTGIGDGFYGSEITCVDSN